MPLKVSQADFERYFNAFGKSFKCEICSHDSFTLLNDLQEETVGLVARREGRPLQAIELIAMSCVKCGNVKSFLGHHVADWVEENPE